MARWDWRALELIRVWERRPDDTTPVGTRVYHKLTSSWFSFGELCGDDVIVVDPSGAASVIPIGELKLEWDPDIDPDMFNLALTQIKRSSNVSTR